MEVTQEQASGIMTRAQAAVQPHWFSLVAECDPLVVAQVGGRLERAGRAHMRVFWGVGG